MSSSGGGGGGGAERLSLLPLELLLLGLATGTLAEEGAGGWGLGGVGAIAEVVSLPGGGGG